MKKKKAMPILCSVAMCLALLFGVPFGQGLLLENAIIVSAASTYTSSITLSSSKEYPSNVGSIFVVNGTATYTFNGFVHFVHGNSSNGKSFAIANATIDSSGKLTLGFSPNETYTLSSGKNAWVLCKSILGNAYYFEQTYYNPIVNDAAYSSTTSFTYNGSSKTAVTGSNVDITGTNTATNAGSYTAYVTPQSGHAWSDGTTDEKTVSWSISRANISPSVTMNGWTYGDTASNPSVSGNTENGTVTYHYSTSQNGTYNTTKPSNAGTYWIYASIAQTTNYNSATTDKKSFTISKATATVTAPTAKTLTYTGSAQTLINAGSTTGGTLQYKLGSGSYGTGLPSATDVGTYTVYYKVVGGTNYNDVAEKSITVAIKQATNQWSTSAVKQPDWTYDASTKSLFKTVPVPEFGSVQYRWKKDSGSWSDYSTTVPSAKDVGTYDVEYKVDGTTNYTALSGSFTVKVTKATNAWTLTPAVPTLTYNGNARSLLSNVPTAKFGAVQYSIDNSTWQSSVPTRTDAGNYTIYCKVDETSNYTGLTWSNAVTINKADPTKDHLNYTAPTNLTYNGSGKVASFSLKSPYTKAGTITAEYQKSGTSTWTADAPTEAGTYNVRANVAVGDNFNAGTVTNNWSFTIAKATPTVTAPQAKTGLQFTGEDQALIKKGTTTGGTMLYSLDKTIWSEEIPTGNDVGEYTVYYKVDGGSNYNDNVGNTSGEPIKVYINPAYYVTIPADITLTEENGQVSGTGNVVAEYYIGSKRLTVTVNSENDFNLAGAKPETAGISVPYTVTPSGQATALAQNGTVMSVTTKGTTTVQLNMSADTSKMYAGAYKDTLTFSISLS